MPIIQIEPLDTLFFRDGKPFNMGDETWAEGMFPPNPSVIWGALFSAFFEKEIREENLPNEDSLKIEKIYLYSGSKKELYLPSPLDLFCYEENKKEELVLAASYGLETISNKRAIYADNEIPVFQLENQFLNRTAFHNYFENFYGFEFELIKNENVFSKPNPKIGIKRDSKTRSSRDGNLYRVNMMEFDPEMDLKILVEISNEFIHAEKNKSGFLKLGGKEK
jgi:CRISPR-associated protein Cmr3